MKIIIFDGRIGAKGAEVLSTKGGKPFVRFSVANNSFVNGQDKTEWFDVTSYDPFVIESKVKYLTKGTPVQIVGSLNTEVKVDNQGKVWVNQYVTADRIELMFNGKKDEDNQDGQNGSVSEGPVSTMTGGTQSEAMLSGKEIAKKAPAQKPQPQPEPEIPMNEGSGGEDDLPF